MATVEQALSTLEKLVAELAKRQRDTDRGYGVDTLMKAYDGDFSLHYASSDFKEFFADRYSRFSDNWCGIVADAPHERLEVTGIRLPDQKVGDKSLWDAWLRNDADALSDLAFLDAIVAKRSYALVWGDEDDEATITWEHPSQAIVGYDPETRARRAGAKVWADDDREYATLYLPAEVWKFQRDRVQSSLELPTHLTDGAWTLRAEGVIDNPLGKVPLVEIPNRPRLMGEPHSDITAALAMQHAINLFWAELFAVADEATLGQRILIGGEMPKVPILDEAGEIVGERPVDLKKLRRDNILWIEGADGNTVSPHQWEAAKLDVFTNVIEIMVGHIAAQTRTPAHYLLIGGTIANVSGDAMKALETGLVKRTEEKTQHFGRGVRDVFELVALAEGDAAKAKSVRSGQTLWKDVENRSDAQRADALSKKRDIGYPLRYLLEQDGLSPTEIDRVMDMVADEREDPVLSQIMKDAAGGNADAGAGA